MLSTSKLLTSSISKDPAADASAEAHASVNLWHNKTIFPMSCQKRVILVLKNITKEKKAGVRVR
jgi:hypothetical protein